MTTIATVVLLNIDDPTWGAWAWWWGQTERATRASMFLTDVAYHLPCRSLLEARGDVFQVGSCLFGNPAAEIASLKPWGGLGGIGFANQPIGAAACLAFT